jgi:hypothetical protein
MKMQSRTEQETLRDIRQELEQVKSRLEQAEQGRARAERRARRMGGLALVMFVGMVAWASMPKSWAQGYGATLANLLSRVTALEKKTQYMSVSGTDVFFTGCNVHIRNGQNSTITTNGLGNLIVGYNESRSPFGSDDRTGSHNIVVGMENNFSSYGGLVVGDLNTISGAFASVSGGGGNIANGNFASVSGGRFNTASNLFASVSGGFGNTASGEVASVSGGESITQSAFKGWSAGSSGTTVTGKFRSP